jgi:hypothetical protein
VLICWRDHEVDEDGEIFEKEKRHLGLKFVGFRKIDKLLKYNFRWKDIQLVNGQETEQFHEVVRDWILIRPDVYIITIERAETAPNWFENLTVRLNALYRNFIACRFWMT